MLSSETLSLKKVFHSKNVANNFCKSGRLSLYLKPISEAINRNPQQPTTSIHNQYLVSARIQATILGEINP